ncbi:MAG: addiction module protein [Methylococcaceae bacterium]|nr:addiction module protein [Methylococcaceae bacterium]
MNIDQITSVALTLTPHDKALLAQTLWESLEAPYLADTELSDHEAIALAKQRDREIDQGLVQALAHSQLMSSLRNAD